MTGAEGKVLQANVTGNLKLYLLRRREQGLLPGLSFSS